ncbi:SRPBCC domain-containing protein [Candidatus Woesebacteria bacterium]|nr:SRPBCC domain-containing protein [Candidatus Woesebacteria bacterium]
MKTLHFSIFIKAPAKEVWHAMLDDRPYREWTSAFNPGSYYEGSWEEGSKILFLGPDESGNIMGLVSKIGENREYEYISIHHLGVIKNGVESTDPEVTKGWEGAKENYTFKSENGGTTVLVDVDSTDDDAKYFENAWPDALKKLKVIAER